MGVIGPETPALGERMGSGVRITLRGRRPIPFEHDSAIRLDIAIVLARIHSPEQSHSGRGDQNQAQRNQQQNDGHEDFARASRAEFNTTARELPDIPSAATHGEIAPAAARGTMVMLYRSAQARF